MASFLELYKFIWRFKTQISRKLKFKTQTRLMMIGTILRALYIYSPFGVSKVKSVMEWDSKVKSDQWLFGIVLRALLIFYPFGVESNAGIWKYILLALKKFTEDNVLSVSFQGKYNYIIRGSFKIQKQYLVKQLLEFFFSQQNKIVFLRHQLENISR